MAKEGEREHRSENNDKNRERSRFYTTLKPFYSRDLNLNYFASAMRFSQFSTENLV